MHKVRDNYSSDTGMRRENLLKIYVASGGGAREKRGQNTMILSLPHQKNGEIPPGISR